MTAPLLIAWLGVGGAAAVSGGCLLVLVAARARGLRRLEESRPVPERPFALLRGVAFLAPVPLATLETLALRMRPVAVGAGEAVVREGEPGERFYLVDDGALDVQAGGRTLTRLVPGDFFGEIALLRGVPRTATVTAAGGARLYALGRDEFLAAVTGVPRAALAAERVASERILSGKEDAAHAR